MTTITAVRKTKRGRYALFSGDEFLFSLDEDTYAGSGVGPQAVLTDAQLAGLREACDSRKAADQALRYLAVRAHGEQELYQKLLARHDEYSAAAAMAKMRELGLLDDEQYARDRAEGLAARGKSPAAIRQKLLALGLDRRVVAGALDALGLDGAASALALVRKAYMHALEAGGREKVLAALARRGFSRGDALAAVRAAEAELGLDAPRETFWEDP